MLVEVLDQILGHRFKKFGRNLWSKFFGRNNSNNLVRRFGSKIRRNLLVEVFFIKRIPEIYGKFYFNFYKIGILEIVLEIGIIGKFFKNFHNSLKLANFSKIGKIL